LSPLYGANTCWGSTMPRTPTKASAQNGVGLVKWTLMVWLSTFSTLMSLYVPMFVDAVAGSATYSQVNTQSSAVNGLPSCQVTPFLSFQVTDLPSLERPPFCTVGISAARVAARLPSGSHQARRAQKNREPSWSLVPVAKCGFSRVALCHPSTFSAPPPPRFVGL